MLQKAAEKTTEAMRSSATVASAGLENLVSHSGMEQFRSLDAVSMPAMKSVNSSSRSALGPTASLSQLPFFAHSSVGTSVRAPGLLSSTFSASDSTPVAASAQKLSQQSKGKPLSASLLQQEPRSGSTSSVRMPTIPHQLVAGSQNSAFDLINSQLQKAADSSLAAVLVAPPGNSTAAVVKSVAASIPPRASYSLSTARASLPLVTSANIGLSTANSASIAFASSVPAFSSVSKPVVARLMAQQRLPGVLALSGMPLCPRRCMFALFHSTAVCSVTFVCAVNRVCKPGALCQNPALSFENAKPWFQVWVFVTWPYSEREHHGIWATVSI